MQRINRSVEIAVFLLQPCELGLEFALIFVGHGLLNQNADEICENSDKPSAVDLTFASGAPRVLEERMSNPKPHSKQMFGGVPLVLTFVNEPAAIRYECQNSDTNPQLSSLAACSASAFHQDQQAPSQVDSGAAPDR